MQHMLDMEDLIHHTIKKIEGQYIYTYPAPLLHETIKSGILCFALTLTFLILHESHAFLNLFPLGASPFPFELPFTFTFTFTFPFPFIDVGGGVFCIGRP